MPVSVEDAEDEAGQVAGSGQGRRQHRQIAAQVDAHRFLPLGPVVLQVLQSEDAAPGADVLDQSLGRGAVVELVDAVVGDPLKRLGEDGPLQQVALLQRLTRLRVDKLSAYRQKKLVHWNVIQSMKASVGP